MTDIIETVVHGTSESFQWVLLLLVGLVIFLGLGTVVGSLTFIFKNVYFIGGILALFFIWRITKK